MDFSENSLFSDDVWRTQGPRLSFSHSGEDRLLSVLFEDYPSGFYVDFGCFHPFIYSNTYLLHRRGWSGINLDASPDAISSMNTARPNDINVHLALGEYPGTAKLAYFGEFASSNTTSHSFAQSISEKQGVSVERMIDVESDNTKNILDKYLPNGTPIDYWNIDLEGFDLIALKTNDWERYRPTVISVEDFIFTLHNPMYSEIDKLLRERGYFSFSRYLYTTFYVDPTQAGRLRGLPEI